MSFLTTLASITFISGEAAWTDDSARSHLCMTSDARAPLNLVLQALAGFHGKVLRCGLLYNYLNHRLLELIANTHIHVYRHSVCIDNESYENKE